MRGLDEGARERCEPIGPTPGIFWKLPRLRVAPTEADELLPGLFLRVESGAWGIW